MLGILHTLSHLICLTTPGKVNNRWCHSHFSDRKVPLRVNSLAVLLLASSRVHAASGLPGFQELFPPRRAAGLIHSVSPTLPKSRYSIKIRRTEYSYELTTTLLISCSRPIPSPLPSRFLYSSSDIHTGCSPHLREKCCGHIDPHWAGKWRIFKFSQISPTALPTEYKNPPHTRQHVTRRLYPS